MVQGQNRLNAKDDTVKASSQLSSSRAKHHAFQLPHKHKLNNLGNTCTPAENAETLHIDKI